MATLGNLKAGSQALLVHFMRDFKIWQENYRNDPVRSPDGRYWQGILWPQTLPDDGAIVEPPDSETDASAQDTGKPQVSWRQVIREVGHGQINKPLFWEDMHNALGTPGGKPQCVFSMQCDEYQTPHDGVGYTVTVQFTKDGDTYERTVGVGPLTEERAHAWRKRVESPV